MSAECKRLRDEWADGPTCSCGYACALDIAVDARYHIPRSQVWEGSRGRQAGKVHLHVTEQFSLGRIHRKPGQALCGKRGWSERPAEGEELCPRCADIRDRVASFQDTRGEA